MGKLWDGRFEKETNPAVNDFNSSLRFDKRMYRQDIFGSIAHATMLGKQGIIPAETAEKICTGLRGILADIDAGRVDLNTDAEDIHMFVESLLTERIGDDGKRLHTGRSRCMNRFCTCRRYWSRFRSKTKRRGSPAIRTFKRHSRSRWRTILWRTLPCSAATVNA